ncbi:MAG: hypothetical protein ABGX83_06750 [Nitrospira sp.]
MAQGAEETEVVDNKIGKRVFYVCLAFFWWICYFLMIGSVPPGLHG